MHIRFTMNFFAEIAVAHYCICTIHILKQLILNYKHLLPSARTVCFVMH